MWKTHINVNIYLAGFLSFSFTLHTTVIVLLPVSYSSGYKNRIYRCSYLFFSAFSGVLFSFPAPQYEYCLRSQSALNSSGNNLCVNMTPICPGLWLWCLNVSNSATDICASGMSKKFSGIAGSAGEAIGCRAKCISGAACITASG